MSEPQEAISLCENAIKECMALMDDMPEEKFSEVSNLCELIKENILVWSGKEKKEWLNLWLTKKKDSDLISS